MIRYRPSVAGLVATVMGAATISVTTAHPAVAVPLSGCPALFILGVQGTGQSSPTADPLSDTGVVGSLIGPVVAAVPELVQRSYIAYQAGFGGIVPGGGDDPYTQSVAQARTALDVAAQQIIDSCPETMLAGVGYSQGAQAMSSFARDVGAGAGSVPADRVAAVALYANPDRATMEPVFPGRPDQTTPDPAPGTAGAAVSMVQILAAPASGAGIATSAQGYGALTGRVADVCSDGDLACSAPANTSLLRWGAQVLAQADLTDPLAALTTVNHTLAHALGSAWNAVILNDFHVSGGAVTYLPEMRLGERLVEAADPRGADTDASAAGAHWDQITAAIAADPAQLGPVLAQLVGAVAELATDNADVVNPAVWLRFADTVGRHNSYAQTGQLSSGTAWMIALAHDLAGARS
ncbi:cutinase family protein [Nocardia sp. NPDC058658]|uniref:cutinase family protein n=1 Tax=Nocardia sp. NPDC058658 TaxID=3346580 RepID=UPI00365F8265